jgi:hypothetical protein
MKRLAVLIPPLAAVAACSADMPVQPGYWETETRMNAGQMELWRSTLSKCLFDDEAANPGVAILTGTPLGPCETGESRYEGGQILARGTCVSIGRPEWPSVSTRVTLEGRYTTSGMEGRITAEPIGDSDRVPMTGTMTARRTGDC